jgi:hypothetical protein
LRDRVLVRPADALNLQFAWINAHDFAASALEYGSVRRRFAVDRLETWN